MSSPTRHLMENAAPKKPTTASILKSRTGVTSPHPSSSSPTLSSHDGYRIPTTSSSSPFGTFIENASASSSLLKSQIKSVLPSRTLRALDGIAEVLRDTADAIAAEFAQMEATANGAPYDDDDEEEDEEDVPRGWEERRRRTAVEVAGADDDGYGRTSNRSVGSSPVVVVTDNKGGLSLPGISPCKNDDDTSSWSVHGDDTNPNPHSRIKNGCFQQEAAGPSVLPPTPTRSSAPLSSSSTSSFVLMRGEDGMFRPRTFSTDDFVLVAGDHEGDGDLECMVADFGSGTGAKKR